MESQVAFDSIGGALLCKIIQRMKNMILDSYKSQTEQSLDEILHRLENNEIIRDAATGFSRLIENHQIPSAWIETHLRRACFEHDVIKISLLLNFFGGNVSYKNEEEKSLARVLCQIIEDPSLSILAEDVIDVMDEHHLDANSLHSFVRVFTLPVWGDTGHWPDFTKAVSLMYKIYRDGACSREEIVSAFFEILENTNVKSEDRGAIELIRFFVKEGL